tara:strand:+ start:13312 stop:13818 length:507 start_codon:yes stop_codon:yes gene_type:complete
MIVLSNKRNKNSLMGENMALSNIRAYLLKNDVAEDICKEFGFDKNILYGVSISFDSEIDVAAKTTDSKMLLNTSLLDEKFDIIMRYVIHELVHVFQHIKREGIDDPYDGMEYLERPDEVQAFQFQVEFQEDFSGENDAKEYVDDLIEYHEIDDNQKDDKKEELLDRVG